MSLPLTRSRERDSQFNSRLDFDGTGVTAWALPPPRHQLTLEEAAAAL